MIRLIRCIKRRPDLSVADFRQAWNDDEYRGLLDEAFTATHAVRVVRNLTLQVGLNEALREFHDQDEPFDAVMEIWWESAQALQSTLDAETAGTLQLRLNGYEDDFIDRASSRFFFTEDS